MIFNATSFGPQGDKPAPTTGPCPVGKTPKDTAVRMMPAGLWPIPLYPRPYKDGKQPIGKGWGLKRNTTKAIHEFFRNKPKAGIGVALGPYRAPGKGWLIDVEGDGPEAEESRLRLYGGQVVETLGWGSARGGHQLLTADVARLAELLPGLAGLEIKGIPSPGVYKLPEFPGLEIRFGGFFPGGIVKQIQSVFPPTVGTDGKPRQWNGVAEIAEAPETIYQALQRAAVKPAADPTPTVISIDEHLRRTTKGRPDDETRAGLYLDTIDPAISGQRGHDKTFAAACKVGPGFDLPPEVALRLLMDRYNPRCVPPWSEKDLRHKNDDAYRVEARRGFLRDADRDGYKGNGQKSKGAEHKAPTAPRPDHNGFDYRALTRAQLGLTRASDIKGEPVDWLWDDRVPLGMLTLLAGEGSDGKSQITIAIAAAVSTAGKLPDGTQAPLGRVIILAAEDSTKKTIIPRLIAAGADMRNVDILTAKVTQVDEKGRTVVHPQCLADLDYWRAVFSAGDEGQPCTRLFIVDTLPGLMKGINDSRNNEIRGLMEPFIDDVIDPMNIAMIGITHMNKSIDHKTPVHKILGSVAYPNLSRSVFCTYRDPDDKTRKRRYMCHVKINVGEERPTLGYSVEKVEVDIDGTAVKTARVVFEEAAVELSAQDIMAAGNGKGGGKRGPDPEKTTRASEWLYDFLKSEARPVPIAAVFDAAGPAGHAGNKKPDGGWTGVGTVYDAVRMIVSLPEPRNGCRVETLEMPLKSGGRKIKHWYICSAEAAF